MKIKLLIVLFFISFSSIAAKDSCRYQEKVFQEGYEYFSNGHYLLASQLFSQSRLQADPDCERTFKAGYFQSASFLLLQDVKAFDISLGVLVREVKSPSEKEQIHLLRAYAYDIPNLPDSNSDLQRRWGLWRSRKKTDLKDFNSPELNKIHEDYIVAINTKSPVVAGVLSAILPGAGQMYIGAYQSAALALIFNGLLLGTTLEFSRKNMDVAALTSGTLFSMTYLGNILSATKGASQLNTSNAYPYERDLRRGLLPELEF
jgi:TM2 domain-containing membrane protein YozV